MLRVVLDTNVILSGLMHRTSTPGRVLRAWRDGKYRLVLSEFLLREISMTLARPKLRRLVKWSDNDIKRFELELRAFSEVVEHVPLDFDLPRDPDDTPVLATLIASRADVLVTGDGDLLVLRDRYPIETPAEFARRL